jgi:hypothetical protein
MPACPGIHPREPSCLRHVSGRPVPIRVPPLTSCPRYHPRAPAALVVSHHLDGLSRPEIPGLLHPGTGQDSPRFGPTRPTPKCGPDTSRSQQRCSHPSKISPRWQPYRITAAVAPSAFARCMCPSTTSRPSQRSRTQARPASRSEDRHLPNGRSQHSSRRPRRPWTDGRLDIPPNNAGVRSSRPHVCCTLLLGPPACLFADEPEARPPASQRLGTRHLSRARTRAERTLQPRTDLEGRLERSPMLGLWKRRANTRSQRVAPPRSVCARTEGGGGLRRERRSAGYDPQDLPRRRGAEAPRQSESEAPGARDRRSGRESR